MNKICTLIEESLKLIELGIDVNTADMYYPNRVGGHNYPLPIECKMGLPLLSQEIPAWSLPALLKLMPRIEGLKPFIDLGPKLDSEDVSIYYHSEDSPYIVRDNPIDAAFEMVCWLLENKKL